MYRLKIDKSGVALQLPGGSITRSPINIRIKDDDINVIKTYIKMIGLSESEYLLEKIDETAVQEDPKKNFNHNKTNTIDKPESGFGVGLKIQG